MEELRRDRRFIITAGVLALLVVSCLPLLIGGCSDRHEVYRKGYVTTINAFQKKAVSDDKASEQLIEKNDIGGLITMIKNRVSNINQVVSKIMKLDPPSGYIRLQVLTLYYLIELKKQFNAQNQLNEAILNGQPLADLKSIAEKYSENTQFSRNELLVELQKIGIRLTGGTTGKPQTSGTSSASIQMTAPQASTPEK